MMNSLFIEDFPRRLRPSPRPRAVLSWININNRRVNIRHLYAILGHWAFLGRDQGDVVIFVVEVDGGPTDGYLHSELLQPYRIWLTLTS